MFNLMERLNVACVDYAEYPSDHFRSTRAVLKHADLKSDGLAVSIDAHGQDLDKETLANVFLCEAAIWFKKGPW
jgi:hypothetical protein